MHPRWTALRLGNGRCARYAVAERLHGQEIPMLNRIARGGLVHIAVAIVAILAAPGAPATAQETERATDCPDCAASGVLSDEPRVFHTQEQTFRVVPMKGLNRPWALEFLPNGDMLITEHGGQLRIVRDGVLDPEPLAGIPEVFTPRRKGLMDIALHPRFEENQFVYFTYHKASPKHRLAATTVLARGKYEGRGALVEVRDLFVSDADYMGAAQTSRILFAPDGTLFMVVGQPARYEVGSSDYAQDPSNHAGKMLRLNDDGSVPDDNPFVDTPGHRPEIYAFGIRNANGLAFHPETGELWETENGPQGGDELNIIEAGRNYGWPVVSYGLDYTGNKLGGLSGTTSEHPWAPGMEEPFAFWMPSPALAGIIFYTGDKFPTWKGNAFIGALGRGNLGTRQLHRVVFNREGGVQRNGIRTVLSELKQRIRTIRQGPDDLLYLATDEPDGAVLRIEPVEPQS
jgi:glucose/arabinose dehydrogenase